MKTIILSLALLTVLWGSPAAAQVFKSDVSKKGTTAASFLSISQGARASSMGSAFVAVADDWSTLYWNPAGIASMGNGIQVDHTNWIADIGYNFIGGSVTLGSLGSLGLSITSSSIGDMAVTTVADPDGTGEVFNVSDVAVGITYALKLTDNFSIGFTPKYIYERIWKMSADALAMDVGVKYQTPFKGITLGMAITNFGQKMHITGENSIVLYDSDVSDSENNANVAAELQTGYWSLPLNFRVGLAYRPDLGDDHKVIVAVDALHPSDDYESVNVGAEYTFDDFVSFRGGYKALFLKDSEESYTFGVGFKQHIVGNITILADYSYMDFGRLKNVNKITIGMAF